MLLFNCKNKLLTSLFWVFLSLFELSVLWNILLSTFSFITVEKVRQMGHAKSLHKFIVFLFQTSCSPSPLKPGQPIKKKVAWAAKSGRQKKRWETWTWGLVQDRANPADRESRDLGSGVNFVWPSVRLWQITFPLQASEGCMDHVFKLFNKGPPFITKNNLAPNP